VRHRGISLCDSVVVGQERPFGDGLSGLGVGMPDVIAFLASSAAGDTNGQNLCVDGGIPQSV
jgi:NAD(P)-dependent dehydrogenase (short-subunit alcohol dehydrogenase family)